MEGCCLLGARFWVGIEMGRVGAVGEARWTAWQWVGALVLKSLILAQIVFGCISLRCAYMLIVTCDWLTHS